MADFAALDMGRKKNNTDRLILPESFVSELKSIIDFSPRGCRITSRQARWLDSLLSSCGLDGMKPEELCAAYEQLQTDRASRKQNGVFYTPPETVDLILDEALDGWCEANPNEVPRVLEPACGAGIFALGVVEKLYCKLTGENVAGGKIQAMLCDAIRINDIDRNALAIASMCFARKLSDLGGTSTREFRINATANDFLDVAAWSEHLEVGDGESGYDVIVGNPPYVSYYARGSQGISDVRREEWSRHFISAKGRVNTYLLFIEMAIKLLRPGGRLGFIIPNTFLIMKSYERLRRHALDACHLRYIADLSMGVFPGAEVPCCVVVLEKRGPLELALDHPVKVLRRSEHSGAEEALMDSGRFRKLPYFMFNVGLDRATCEIIDQMESGAEQLKMFVDIRDGINPANIKGKMVSEEREGPAYKPVLVGKDIKPFSLEWSGLFVNYDASAVDKSKGEYCFLREERIFLAEKKLVNRQTARRLIAALDDEQYYALNSCHLTLIEDDRLDIMYLLSLYNSDLLNFYYSAVFRDTEKVFPQVKTANVEKLPLKFGDPECLARIVSVACEMSRPVVGEASRSSLMDKLEKAVASVYGLTDKQANFMRERVPK